MRVVQADDCHRMQCLRFSFLC